MLRKLAEEEDRVLIWRNCRPCGGDGRVRGPHCALCGQEAAAGDAWWQHDVDELPCGHPAVELVDTVPCDACDGSGRSRQWVPLTEYRAIRRRAIARGIVLLVAGLLPFVALGIAVYQGGLDNVCGSWWYGLLLLPAIILDDSGQVRYYLFRVRLLAGRRQLNNGQTTAHGPHGWFSRP